MFHSDVLTLTPVGVGVEVHLSQSYHARDSTVLSAEKVDSVAQWPTFPSTFP